MEHRTEHTAGERLLRSVATHRSADLEIRELVNQRGQLDKAIEDKRAERDRALLALSSTASEIRLKPGARFYAHPYVYRMTDAGVVEAERAPLVDEFVELGEFDFAGGVMEEAL